MAKEKTPKTNAMRILDRLKISYEVLSYQCDEFIDGIHTADTLGIPHENCFKTLVLQGKSKGYSVFVLPIEEELNLKECAKAVNEKSVEMIHVKDINKITGYIRGGCSPLGMKKQFRTFIEMDCLNQDKIYFSAGKIGMQIQMDPKTLMDLIHVQAGDITKE
mgnify:CR=1 FL=1